MEVAGLGALPMDTNEEEAVPWSSALLGGPHCPVPCGSSRAAAESVPFSGAFSRHTREAWGQEKCFTRVA